MKHTKGPWQIRTDGLGVVVADNNLLHPTENEILSEEEGGSDDFFIADCVDSAFARGDEECEANARLITESPTMYDYIQEQAIKGDKKAKSIIIKINA